MSLNLRTPIRDTSALPRSLFFRGATLSGLVPGSGFVACSRRRWAVGKDGDAGVVSDTKRTRRVRSRPVDFPRVSDEDVVKSVKSGGGSVGGASSRDTHLDGSLERLDLPVNHLHTTAAALLIGAAASPSAAFAAIATHDV